MLHAYVLMYMVYGEVRNLAWQLTRDYQRTAMAKHDREREREREI